MSGEIYDTRTGAAGGVVLRAGVLRRISRDSVFAGLFLVLAIQLLLSMLGFGIGLSMLQPGRGGVSNAGSIGTGAAIW